MRLSRYIDPQLKVALSDYFRAKYHDGTGVFESSATKKVVCDAVIDAARKLGWGCSIFPGTIFMTCPDKSTIVFNRSNRGIGKRFDSSVTDPMSAYFDHLAKRKSRKS